MKQELEKQLLEKFPRLYIQHSWGTDKSCMAWGFPNHDGWFSLIYRMSAALEVAFQNLPEEERTVAEKEHFYTVGQIKNKFGVLRVYMDFPKVFASGSGYEAMRAIIEKAEEESEESCMKCGLPGTYAGMSVFCENHNAYS